MKQWTVEELRYIDDVTFAMSILSEQQKASKIDICLSQKIAAAIDTLDKIRGGGLIAEEDCWQSIRTRAFREIEREYIIENIKTQLEGKNNAYGGEVYDLYGLTIDEILSDREIIDNIVNIFNACECGDIFWDNLDNSIEQGIEDVIKCRTKKDNYLQN